MMKKGYLIQMSTKVVFSDNTSDGFGDYSPLFVSPTIEDAKCSVKRFESRDARNLKKWSSLDERNRGCILLHSYSITEVTIL